MDNSAPLNERQKAIYDFICQKIKTDGYAPSVREIAHAVGLKSTSTVHSHLVHLEEKGYIKKDPSKPRAMIPVNRDKLFESNINVRSLPLVGNVAAGTPILAVENIESYIPVPDEFVGSGNYYLLCVKGESMIEAGILDGDYLIVREQTDAANGEIVIAMLDDEATVKRLYRRSDHVELKPENSAMQPIICREVSVLGKVTGLIRNI